MRRTLLILLLSIVCAICCAFALTACGDNGNGGDQGCTEPELTPTEGLEYTLNGDGESYSVTGIGTAEETDIVIAKKYEGLPVTAIGSEAFRNCTDIINITIPDSIISIGESAFRDCLSIESISIPNSVTSIGDSALRDCSSLVSATIPNNLTFIGARAFNGCASLANISIPNSVTSIGNSSFGGCISLTTITIPESVTSMGTLVFNGCSSLETVYWNAENCTLTNATVYEATFYNCTALTTVKIGDNVQSIPEYMFYGCLNMSAVYVTDLSNWCQISFGDNPLAYAHNLYLNNELLTELVIPYNVASISEYAFSNCRSITSIIIYNVSSIGNSAFYGCTGLTSLNLPDCVTYIGKSAFSGCTSLTNVTIGNMITSIRENVFSGCTSLKNAIIGDGVTSFALGAFSGCTSLESITLPFVGATKGEYLLNSHIGYIFGDNFNNATVPASLKNVIITSGNNIGSSAFKNCTNIESVTIADSVTQIWSGAFSTCVKLSTVTFSKNSQIKIINDKAFYNCYLLKSIVLPSSIIIIANQAFVRSGLKTIYYMGTTEEWQKVEIYASGLGNGTPYFYSEENPFVDGVEEENFWHYVDGEPVVWIKQN